MSSLSELIKSRSVYVPSELTQYQDIFRYFRGKKIGEKPGEADSRPLLGSPADFYINPLIEKFFLQGDILNSIAPIWIDSSGEASQANEPTLFMILSNECDTEKRENGSSQRYIRVCPVYKEDHILAISGLTGAPLSNLKGNLVANKMSEYFWMPSLNEHGNLVADLGHIYSVDLEWLHGAVESKKIDKLSSLSTDAYYLLLIKLSWFFLRPVTDTRRPAN